MSRIGASPGERFQSDSRPGSPTGCARAWWKRLLRGVVPGDARETEQAADAIADRVENAVSPVT